VGDAGAASGEPVYGGEITTYFQEFYNNYDPSIADNRNYAIWYESLFAMDWGLENSGEIFVDDYMHMSRMTGQLAEDYTFEDSVMTVKLRDDVYFQDKAPYNGRKLTAGDVKWNYDRLLGYGEFEGNPIQTEVPWPVILYMVESVETEGENTVIFRFNTSSELALNDFITSQVCIGGPEWDELSDAEKSDWRNAAGTGPFILEEYVPDSHMTFVKNENYYGYDERHPENKLPYIDKLTYQLVADTTNLVTQFKAGRIDVIAWGGNVLTRTEIEQVRGMPADSYKEYNFIGAPPGIGYKLTYEPFSDIRVRTALQMAINSEEIYTKYYDYDVEDLGIPGLFAFSTGYSTVDEWDQELYDSYYTYDPEGAKRLLAEAGYADGFAFDVVIFGALDADLFTLAASYLSKVGVTMNVTVAASPMEMQQIGYDESNGKSIFVAGGKSRKMEILATFGTGGATNSIFNNDPAFDEMLDKLNRAETLEEAERISKEMDLYFAQQHWVLHLGGGEVFTTFLSSRIGGYTGERLWKNWNANTILSHVWATDASK
jgi:peptide/nickel transport system substrate-binding protein